MAITLWLSASRLRVVGLKLATRHPFSVDTSTLYRHTADAVLDGGWLVTR